MPRAIDVDELLTNCADDWDLVRQVVRVFRADAPRMLSRIRESLAAGDSTALHRAAHSFKGSVATFGPSACLDAARELERIGREGGVEAATAELESLERHLVRLESDLTEFVEAKHAA